MSTFIVDSNFFIQAHRMYYPLDVAITFWNQVESLAIAGSIISIDKVKNEIYQNDDDLKAWCQSKLPSGFFKDTSSIIGSYSEVVNWTMGKTSQYIQGAINEFLDADEADAWLIAYGKAHGLTLTTYEKSAPNAKKKIKIPEPCIDLGVNFTDTIGKFRALGVKF